MKAFNVAASQIWMPNIPMSAIPAGSYYGQTRVDYTVKIRDGIDFIYDKNGHTVYNPNGTPKMKVLYKTVKKCHMMTYIVTDTRGIKYPDGTIAFDAWVQYDSRDNKWIHTTLVDNKCLETLNSFILKCEKTTKNLPAFGENTTIGTTGRNIVKPRRKQVQKTYLYKTHLKPY